MKKTTKNGKVIYYYYKKKRGRKLKRGPKKKTPVEIESKLKKYRIIKCISKRQYELIGEYDTIEDVENKKNELINSNEKIIFPKKNNNICAEINDYECEYVLLRRKNKMADTDNISLVRNDYGKFVEHKTDKDNWIIYDKFPCIVEERFFVYGYDSKKDRKTFQWIFDNLIDIVDIVRIMVYNNKVILQYDYDVEIIICKNTSDAIRFYNLAEEKSKKLNNIIYTGSLINRCGRKYKQAFDMIKKKTGWNNNKIYRTKTT